mgnify:CR=1 FL=1
MTLREDIVLAWETLAPEVRILETVASCSPLGREEFARRVRSARTLGDLNLTDERCEKLLRPRINRDFLKKARLPRLRPGAIGADAPVAAIVAHGLGPAAASKRP